MKSIHIKRASANPHPPVGARASLPGRYLATLFFAAVVAVDAGAQTLDDYVEEAIRNNPGLKAMDAGYEASLQRIKQAGGPDDPVLRISALGEMVETRTGQQMATVSIEQQFSWFGTLKAKADAAALTAESELNRVEEARNELVLKVKSAYYPVYEAARLIALYEENLQIIQSYKALATARFRQGNGPMADVIRVDIMTDQLTTEIAVLEIKRRSAELVFNTLLDHDQASSVTIPDSLGFPAMVTADWRDKAAGNPALSAEEKMMEASKAMERAARKQSMPVFGLGFSYTVIGQRPDLEFAGNGKDAYMPMLSVSLPVYRKKYKAAINEAEFMQSYYRARREEKLNGVHSELAVVLGEWEAAKAQYQSLHHHVSLIDRAIRLMLSAVEASGQDYDELLRMRQELLMHETEKVKMVTRAWQAAARFEYLTATDRP